MPYYAELDEENTVTRVVVAPSITWVHAHLDGDWIKTTNDLGSDQYPGPGWTYDADTGDFVAPPAPDPPPDEP